MREFRGRLVERRRVFLLVLGASLLPRLLTAQELDVARLQLRADGERVGVERYRVWRAGGAVNAMGSVVRDQGEEQQIFLQMDADFRPVKYQVIEGRTTVVSGERFADRVRFHTVADGGERWKEFPADGVEAIVESGVAHHYLVLLQILQNAPSARVVIVIPSRGETAVARLVGEAPERVLVGDGAVAAIRYDLDIGGSRRSVWLDSEGRLLRILDEENGLEALRLPTQDSSEPSEDSGELPGTWRKIDFLPKFGLSLLMGHVDHPEGGRAQQSVLAL